MQLPGRQAGCRAWRSNIIKQHRLAGGEVSASLGGYILFSLAEGKTKDLFGGSDLAK